MESETPSTMITKKGNFPVNNCIIPIRSASILAALILLVYAGMSITLWNELALRSAISDLILPVVNGLAACSLFIAARSFDKGTRARFAWTMLAIAELFYTLGDSIWAVIEVGLHQRPYPSIVDLFYIACYPLAMIGILSLPVRPFSPGERLKFFLDMGIVIIAASIGFWVLIIGPAVALNESDTITLVISMIHPVLDLLLIFALLELLFRWINADDWKPVYMFVLSMMIWIVADLLYIPEFISGNYISGGLSDIGSVATYLLIGLAGVIRANSVKSSDEESTITYTQLKWAAYLPYAGVAAAYILLVWSHYNSHYIDFGQMALGIGTLIGLVLLRQIMAMSENVRLFRSAQAEIFMRQEAEDALQESKDYLDNILNSVGDLIFVRDRLHRHILVNDAFCKFVGFRRDEIIGQTIYDLLTREQASVFWEMDEAAFRSGRETITEEMATDAQGNVHATLTKKTFYTDKSRNEFLIGVVRDITQRKIAEDALRDSERKYREFADSLPQIVYEVDMQGNFIFANPSAYTAVGYTKQEFEEGLNVLQTFVLGDRERVIRNIHRLMEGEKIGGQEYMAMRKDGSSFPVVTYSRVIAHEGRTVGLRGVAVDISDIKRAHEEINKLNKELEARVLERTSQLAAANEELKELDNRKAEFITLASHEMRTPLTVINSYLELFIDGTLGELTESQRKKLQIILSQNNRLISLVDTLIDVYNIESRDLKTKIEQVYLPEVAKSSIEGVSRLISLKEHALNLMVEDDLPTVDGDRNRLSQIFYNLLTNAIRYTPERGQIYIDIRRQNGCVLTSISDNGKGIPKKYLERIFEPFFIGEGGSLAIEDGRQGLGLTIVKKMIEAYQGRIWVESKNGRGSTFYFSLPCSKEQLK
jgi:PAS domain S-box-containing protein